jgi:hypothetical protein
MLRAEGVFLSQLMRVLGKHPNLGKSGFFRPRVAHQIE